MRALLRKPEVVAEVRRTSQSRKGLCAIVTFLMLLLPTGPSVAQSVKSCGGPAHAGTPDFDILENTGGKQPATGVANRFEFPVWRTITVGIYKNVQAVREALGARIRFHSVWQRTLTVDLLVNHGAELGIECLEHLYWPRDRYR